MNSKSLDRLHEIACILSFINEILATTTNVHLTKHGTEGLYYILDQIETGLFNITKQEGD